MPSISQYVLLFFFFSFLENLVWVCDFFVCVCVCYFERENKKSEIFVFVFGCLVATLVRSKNMILGFFFFFLGFWSRLMNMILGFFFWGISNLGLWRFRASGNHFFFP